MTRIVALTAGALDTPGYRVQCSGLRWLRPDGHACRANEAIAYCNIGLVPAAGGAREVDPFAAEAHDFQVAFAPRVAGTLRRAEAASRGGFLDQLPYFQLWSPDLVIGHLECADDAHAQDASAGELRLLFACGRRVTGLAEVRTGLLTGWHDRSRAWVADDEGPMGTLLGLGICEQSGILRGEQHAFLELLASVRGPAQAVFVPDDALVPCAPVILDQYRRTLAQSQAIGADLAHALSSSAVAASPQDWLFGGALLAALNRSPLAERYNVLTRTGLRRNVGADAVVLSLHAETMPLLRHRQLGYVLNCHRFRVDEAGPAIRAWLAASFEPVGRTPEEIRADYRALIDAVRARAPMQFLILNCLSTSGFEDICSYAPFDLPLRDTLASIRAKELNLMLHELARERDVAIVDVDAIVADVGAAPHLPDGVHASGALQAEIRAEIVRILHARGVAGFASAGLATGE